MDGFPDGSELYRRNSTFGWYNLGAEDRILGNTRWAPHLLDAHLRHIASSFWRWAGLRSAGKKTPSMHAPSGRNGLMLIRVRLMEVMRSRAKTSAFGPLGVMGVMHQRVILVVGFAG